LDAKAITIGLPFLNIAFVAIVTAPSVIPWDILLRVFPVHGQMNIRSKPPLVTVFSTDGIVKSGSLPVINFAFSAIFPDFPKRVSSVAAEFEITVVTWCPAEQRVSKTAMLSLWQQKEP
jgi:hypothetical protein